MGEGYIRLYIAKNKRAVRVVQRPVACNMHRAIIYQENGGICSAFAIIINGIYKIGAGWFLILFAFYYRHTGFVISALGNEKGVIDRKRNSLNTSNTDMSL